jgi:hypothetical protein
LFAGSEATFCRLVWLVRALEKQAGHWNMEGFFDLSMRPVIAVWTEKTRSGAANDDTHPADMPYLAEAIRQSFTGQSNHADPFV